MNQTPFFFYAIEFFTLIGGILLGITVHEAAHALVANLLGDPTAKWEGRISLNPLRHLDPIGTLSLLILHMGWGKPVPYDPRNFSHPTRDAILTALAGPFANLLTAMILIVPLKHFIPEGSILAGVCSGFIVINISLLVFNLLPIPPLDGSKLLLIVFAHERLKNLAQYSYIPSVIFIVLIGLENVFHLPILSTFLSPITSAIFFFLYQIS